MSGPLNPPLEMVAQRLSRNPGECAQFLRRLVELGIRIGEPKPIG